MTKKSLKKFTVLLNRNEGISILPIIVVMVLMSIMGGVFSHTMGLWKRSAPATINSMKAYRLAETAAMFALQDASTRFFSTGASGPDFPALASGTRSAPHVVLSNGTETAEYWIERPYPSANSIDEYPSGTHRGLNDDATTGADDDVTDDDGDDSANVDDQKRYTIIATGKVKRNGTIVAKRQVKVKASIVSNSIAIPSAAIQTDGSIDDYEGDGPVYYTAPVLDKVWLIAESTSQGHNQSGTWSSSNGYPNSSYYYSGSIPNITYVDGNLNVTGTKRIYGVFYVTGWVNLGKDARVDGIIICDGNVLLDGTGTGGDARIDGGVIQYGGSSTFDVDDVATNIDDKPWMFQDLSNAMPSGIPDITVESWQEAVSAN